MNIQDYIEQAIASFEADPADTEYQKGYLAALVEMQKVLLTS